MTVLTRFINMDGITAVCGGTPNALDFAFCSQMSEEDRDRYKKTFMHMVNLLTLHPDQDEIKLTLGNQSVLLRQSETTYVGVIAVKGHPIVKSLQRMVRQAFKKFGARVPDSRSRVVSTVTPVPTIVPVPAPTTLSTPPNGNGNGSPPTI